MTDEENREMRRIAKGMTELGKKCHCGKVRARHSIREAKECQMKQDTGASDTKLRIMTDQEIEDSHQMKL